MNSAELLVKCLENEGVKYIFGLPGEENAWLLMALEQSKIKFILCRHEQGAAFMANVYGRLTGSPGVCLSTLGPGATNLITGIADANMDRVPLIAIIAQADSHRLHKEGHQNIDIVPLFRYITKRSCTILHPDSIPEITRKAFKTAREEKPGACLIELPCDIASMHAECRLKPLMAENPRRPVPDRDSIKKAAAIIMASNNPIIIAGNGVIREEAYKELRIFAEKTSIGVTSTFMAKGAVSKCSKQNLFTIGLEAEDYECMAIKEADLVIAAGYDFVEYSPQKWNPDGNNSHKKIIHIDYLPAETDECYIPDIEVTGDISEAFRMLTNIIPNSETHFDLSFQHETRRKILKDLESHENINQKGLISPQKIILEISKAMSDEDILISDVGAHKLWIARYFHTENPRTCFIPNGFCPMGFALPGAVGAKIACPDKKVIALCGDGGFLMNMQEMETASRIGANIVVMVWEDGEFGLIKWKQDNLFGHHTDLHFNNPDFVDLARAFGWHGKRITDSATISEELYKAFNCGKPALISIPVDYRENMKLSEHLKDISKAT